MNRANAVLMVLLVISLVSCSTISKKPVSQASERARMFLEQGRREEQRQNFSDALSLYKDAEHYAILSNEFDMQLISLQGEARISYIKGDSISYENILVKMNNIIEHVRPLSGYRLIQLKFWKAFQSKQYADILSENIELQSVPLNARIEILSYLVQVKAKQNFASEPETKQLTKSLMKYKLRLKKKESIHPELISNAYYSLAYAEASVSNYKRALSLLSKAIELDKNYDLYKHLAEDFVLAGKCQRKLDNLIKAKANFVLAHQIFVELNSVKDAESVQLLLNEILDK